MRGRLLFNTFVSIETLSSAADKCIRRTDTKCRFRGERNVVITEGGVRNNQDNGTHTHTLTHLEMLSVI